MDAQIATDTVSSALSGLAGALETPVQIAALALLGLLALELGRVAIEGWRRLRKPRLDEVTAKAMAGDPGGRDIARDTPGPLAEQAVRDLAAAARSGRHDAVEHALADYELRVQRRLDRTRMLVRAGPAVGLMGTLIPLAPGLSVLGEGDFAPLAADLKVAFAATVIGLLVGTSAFALTLVRTRLYTEDLSALERAVAAHAPHSPPHQRVDASIGDHAT
jgi:biopolymer transport protein ExbB/TolQ